MKKQETILQKLKANRTFMLQVRDEFYSSIDQMGSPVIAFGFKQRNTFTEMLKNPKSIEILPFNYKSFHTELYESAINEHEWKGDDSTNKSSRYMSKVIGAINRDYRKERIQLLNKHKTIKSKIIKIIIFFTNSEPLKRYTFDFDIKKVEDRFAEAIKKNYYLDLSELDQLKEWKMNYFRIFLHYKQKLVESDVDVEEIIKNPDNFELNKAISSSESLKTKGDAYNHKWI
jgi:hypothetical protein